MKRFFTLLISILVICACSGFDGCRKEENFPEIFPDYVNVTIPVNIAPLNFQLQGARGMVLEVRGNKRYEYRSCADVMRFREKKWKTMLDAEKGNSLSLVLKARLDGEKVEFPAFFWDVKPEKIDKYLSYRLIEPAYEVWNVIAEEERDMESFRTRLLADNTKMEGTCFNCHISNRASTPTSFFHIRGPKGGTLLNRNGKLSKVNTATPHTSGAAVYGEISPDGRFGIFTTADIRPILHSSGINRFEVFDDSSDLIVVDFENNTVSDSPLVRGKDFQETFPCWSPDGRTIYFCRAESHPQPEETKEMHYNLCSISFDPLTGKLGERIDVLYDARSDGKSVSFPKCSPDGKRILFSVSDYGTFPIWHPETDLRMLDLRSLKIDGMEETNGRYSDSYHCWSSNGKWICWASKRGDRVYGRPYFAYVSEDGKVSGAFVLPQKDPKSYITTLKSYNIPELYQSPEPYDSKYVSGFYSDMECEKMIYCE